MGAAQFISEVVFKTANGMLDVIFLWGGLILAFDYPIYFFIANLKKYTRERKSVSLLTETIILFLIISVAGLIWAIPEALWLLIAWMRGHPFDELTDWRELAWIFSSVRWAELLVVFFVAARLAGREHGKTRWRRSAVIQIAIILFGWLFNRWMGIAFISIPLLAAYYTQLRDLALIVIPASDPEDRVEQKKRANAFISYTWGIQSPMTVVDDHSWKKYEPRISGDITWGFADFPIPIIKNLDLRPGLIWTRSHQVAAISGGTKFKRVDGPGVMFTGKLERLDQVFDLRVQLRTKEIEVVSKDGIHFMARYFTAFRVDNEEWSRDLYNTLRPLNAILRGANKLSHDKGSFPYSNVRVQATLGMTSTKVTPGDSLIYWDQWAMNVIEDQTRKVISQKNLDEMWRPTDDAKFANALDVIAEEIKRNSETILRASGILLVAARVVNFRFDKIVGELTTDEISRQQITTWGSEWEKKRRKILSEAEADVELSKQKARAYGESLLLEAIDEGLQKTHEINPALPRYVIALRFLSVFQDYLHRQPAEGKDGEESEEVKKKMDELRKVFKTWQELFFPGEE